MNSQKLLRRGCVIVICSLLFVGCDNYVAEDPVENIPVVPVARNASSDPVEPVAKSETKADAPKTASAETTGTTKPADATAAAAGNAMGKMSKMAKMDFPAPKEMKFKDDVETNAEAPKDVSELTFIHKDGSTIRMADYLGKSNVILVFTEGFNGMLCPFCMTQTSRLVGNYDKFKERNCEVIVVYPGPDEKVDEFITAALKTEKNQVDRVPFPIVLDKDLKATNFFDINSTHAHPSTYLIDKQGGIQFAYVGENMTADRPSIKSLLAKLDKIQ